MQDPTTCLHTSMRPGLDIACHCLIVTLCVLEGWACTSIICGKGWACGGGGEAGGAGGRSQSCGPGVPISMCESSAWHMICGHGMRMSRKDQAKAREHVR